MNKVFKSYGFALSLVLFLNIIFWYSSFNGGNIYTKDSFEYLHQSENLKTGNYWYAGDPTQPFNNDKVSQRPPLYGVMIFICKSIIQSNYFILLLQCLFGVLIFYLIIKLLKEFEIHISYPIILFLPLLFFPTQMIYTNMIMSELLCQAMILLSFYSLIMFIIKHRIIDLLLFHLFISLAILTKPVWYLFWIPIVALMIYFLWKKRIKIYHLSFVLIPIATVLLISLHNYNQTGYFHYSSVYRTNMVNYNVYLTLANKYNPDEAYRQIINVQDTAETKGSYKDYCHYIESQNIRILIDNLPMYLWLETKGIFNFFVDHGRYDMYSFFAIPPAENMNGMTWYYKHEGIKGVKEYLSQFPVGLLIYLPIISLINVLITFCFLFFLMNKKVTVEIRIAALLFVLYLAVITGPIGAARFRMPVYPILLFTLPFGIETMKRKMN